MNDDGLLDFVKARLEEGEGISPAALARLRTVAERPSARTWKRQALGAVLVAATLAVAVCGWFFAAESADLQRTRNLTNVIDLLYVLEGAESPSETSLSDYLQSWQDAPVQGEDAAGLE